MLRDDIELDQPRAMHGCVAASVFTFLSLAVVWLGLYAVLVWIVRP